MARRTKKRGYRRLRGRYHSGLPKRNRVALRARGVRTHKKGNFRVCRNRDIREAINVWWDPTQKKAAVKFLKKCLRQIKLSQVGKRGGITRGNYRYMLEKVGTRQQMGKFLMSSKRRTMFERAQYGY